MTKYCPKCGGKMDYIEDTLYCMECFFSENDIYYGDESSDEIEDTDYDELITKSSAVCLNCTYWGVSPYGSAHGMVCRKNNFTNGPDDSCSDFSPDHSYYNFGDSGQFQSDHTKEQAKNKLWHWQHSR